MGWEGTETEEDYSTPERIDPFPFTAEGRQYERVERELALAQAVLKVGALVIQRQAVRSKKRALGSPYRVLSGPSPTV
jgi:hypothetical protein